MFAQLKKIISIIKKNISYGPIISFIVSTVYLLGLYNFKLIMKFGVILIFFLLSKLFLSLRNKNVRIITLFNDTFLFVFQYHLYVIIILLFLFVTVYHYSNLEQVFHPITFIVYPVITTFLFLRILDNSTRTRFKYITTAVLQGIPLTHLILTPHQFLTFMWSEIFEGAVKRVLNGMGHQTGKAVVKKLGEKVVVSEPSAVSKLPSDLPGRPMKSGISYQIQEILKTGEDKYNNDINLMPEEFKKLYLNGINYVNHMMVMDMRSEELSNIERENAARNIRIEQFDKMNQSLSTTNMKLSPEIIQKEVNDIMATRHNKMGSASTIVLENLNTSHKNSKLLGLSLVTTYTTVTLADKGLEALGQPSLYEMLEKLPTFFS